jgi:hypothetical protein
MTAPSRTLGFDHDFDTENPGVSHEVVPLSMDCSKRRSFADPSARGFPHRTGVQRPDGNVLRSKARVTHSAVPAKGL